MTWSHERRRYVRRGTTGAPNAAFVAFAFRPEARPTGSAKYPDSTGNLLSDCLILLQESVHSCISCEYTGALPIDIQQCRDIWILLYSAIRYLVYKYLDTLKSASTCAFVELIDLEERFSLESTSGIFGMSPLLSKSAEWDFSFLCVN